MKKSTITFLIMVLFLVGSCVSSPTYTSPPAVHQWTDPIYFCHEQSVREGLCRLLYNFEYV